MLSVLFLVAVISLFPRFSMLSSSRCIEASTLSSMLASPVPPSFLDTHSLSIIIVIFILLLESFSHQRKRMVFHWS